MRHPHPTLKIKVRVNTLSRVYRQNFILDMVALVHHCKEARPVCKKKIKKKKLKEKNLYFYIATGASDVLDSIDGRKQFFSTYPLAPRVELGPQG
jgi:hypothetical protein